MQAGSSGAAGSIPLLVVTGDAEAELGIQQLIEGAREPRFHVECVRPEQARERLRSGTHAAALIDLGRAGATFLEPLLREESVADLCPIVVLAEAADEALTLRSLRLGVQDHLVKGEVGSQLLARSLLHAIERHRLLRDLALARQRERFLAKHDTLTGLPNRNSLQEHLRRALGEARHRGSQLAVLFVDLDGFKSINDTLGHEAGDEALRTIARRMRECADPSSLVARLGGDEFVVVMHDSDDFFTVAAAAEEICSELARPVVLGNRACHITASIGIALFPHDGVAPEPLLRSADAAMYYAKAQGPNQFYFYERKMDARDQDRFQIANNLHAAVDRDELILHYQPQVDVAMRRIVGAEALVRWRHPSRGLISPGDFITIAEETGLIMPIGEWVLRRACTDAMRWDLGPREDFRIAVNVSGRQLGQHGFSQEVACILAETGLSASRLEIEITETSVMDASAAAHAMLLALRRLGVTIAIDDFGTGYSSLTLLTDLPVDRLKIDRSFVRGTWAGPHHVIVRGLIEMARGLGITTIAEGVEEREQVRTLYNQGCHQMQGYLFGKPMTSDEFANLLAEPSASWEQEIEAAGIDF